MDLKCESAIMRPYTKSHAVTILIGVGNPYASDDGVGHYIARELNSKGLPGAVFKFLSGEATLLMEAWKDKEAAIVFDAVSSGARAGKIHRFDAHRQSIPAKFFNRSSHGFGLFEAIELARRLGLLPGSLTVYGIEGKSFRPGVGLSPEVEDAAHKVIRQAMANFLRISKEDQ